MGYATKNIRNVVLLGHSGSGKTTLLRCIAGLLRPQGSIRVRDQWWQDEQSFVPVHKRSLGYVFQDSGLLPHLTVRNNLAYVKQRRVAKGDSTSIDEVAALLGLTGLMQQYPAQLSGGERQRVAIARALSVEPEIILMDEPFSALDLNTRRRMRSEIIRIWQETGKTVIFVTHDIEEALVLADRILLLSNKPTHALETITIDEPRPRNIEDTPTLAHQKQHLISLFRQLEENFEPEEV